MKYLKYSIAILLFIIIFFGTQKLLMPKYTLSVPEGRLIGEYYSEPKNHELIIIGDCEVYENISPVTLWNEYGITSYIRGSAQQLIWQSYYLLEEVLKYEKPDVVMFSVLAMKYDVPQNEAYNRMSIDEMPLSLTKIKSALASLTKEESLLSYLFPIFRYHDRWSSLTSDDFKYFFGSSNVSVNGFMVRTDVKPVDVIPKGPLLPNYRFGDNSYYYLDKMTELCKKNDIELILIKVPSIYPYWYKEWDEQMVDYAEKNDLMYINLLDDAEKVGIDFDTDTYDAGLHLNVFGAEKLASYIGKMLTETYKLTDNRNNAEISALWSEKVNAYNKLKETQLKEINETGAVKTLTAYP